MLEAARTADPYTSITLIRKAETTEAIIFSVIDQNGDDVNFAVNSHGKVGYPEDIIPD